MIDFYKNDKRCGDVVEINGEDAYYKYNADLYEFRQLSGGINGNFTRNIGKNKLLAFNMDFENSGFEATFIIGGGNQEDTDTNVSLLIHDCLNCTFKKQYSEFIYNSVLTSYKVEDTEIYPYKKVTLVFAAIKVLPYIETEFYQDLYSGEYELNNIGTVESGLKIILIPALDMDEVIVNGITITDVLEGEVIIIDGIDGSITCDGESIFDKTDIIEFPKIKPGKNIMEFSELVYIKFGYYPTFLI